MVAHHQAVMAHHEPMVAHHQAVMAHHEPMVAHHQAVMAHHELMVAHHRADDEPTRFRLAFEDAMCIHVREIMKETDTDPDTCPAVYKARQVGAVDDHGRPVMAGQAQPLELPRWLQATCHFWYSRLQLRWMTSSGWTRTVPGCSPHLVPALVHGLRLRVGRERSRGPSSRVRASP